MVSRELTARVQRIARDVLAELGPAITPMDTERSLVERADALLRRKRVHATWYYDCPALVLLGARSCLSISGRDYRPSEESVGTENVITVDLSPMLDGAWGDCARTFFVESGRSVAPPRTPEFLRGQRLELGLHREMMGFISAETTFEELHGFATDRIVSSGFENLDFRGNLGHTIEDRLDRRRYIEPGNSARLIDAGLFTFEPHIREVEGRWGFKHEEIYFVSEDGKAVLL